jgi:hypothetical protein
MNNPRFGRLLLVLVGALLLILGKPAGAEPPSRAARLAFVSGKVSFSPAGQDDWARAVVNRPLTNGDRLWVDAGSRAELQVGGASIRLGASTSVTLLNLDDRIAQLELSEGTLKVRVRRMGANQAFEVDTPNLAFYMNRAGDYRIDVDPNDDATAVRVLSGRAEAYGDGASYAVATGQSYRFYGTGLSDYDRVASRTDDEFDRWGRERDRRADNSASSRYVSSDVVGYQDLDANGTWRRDPEYGNVWTPNRVAAGWTPYRDGHWSWVDPWGWTWVDDAPWGYAVSHYGRWANIQNRWSWVPGPQREQAVYSPALVGFVGGQNAAGGTSVGSALAALIGWFPLAPREVYQPSYPVSRGYFDRINRSNAVIAPATITNIYNTTVVNKTTNVTRVVYVNQRVKDAVVAVPAQAFTHSQPVARAAVPMAKEAASSAPVAPVAAVAPVQQSLHAGEAGTKPPARERGRERRFVARTAPPAPPPAFTAQQQQLAAQPGRPIDEAQRKDMKPAAPAVPAPVVKVVTPAQAPAPTAPPPATAPAAKTPEARKVDAARTEPSRTDEPRRDAGRRDAAKGDTAKADAAKADAAKADAAKADAAKADAAKADAAKADAAKADAAKADAAKADAAKADAAKANSAKAESMKAEAAKAEAAKVDAAKAATEKADAAKAAAAKAEASKADAAKADAARAEAAKAAEAKAAASRADAMKAEAAKANAATAEAAKAAAAKAEASRVEAAKAESARADAAKAAAAKAEASRADAAKAEAAKLEAAKAESAKAEAAKAALAKAEAAKAEATKADAAKIAIAKAEAAKAAREKARASRTEAEKADDDKKGGDDDPRRRQRGERDAKQP